MSELTNIISRLQKGISRNASYIKTIKHPQLLVSSLEELNNLIGNDKLKDAVATQVAHLILMKRRAMENPEIKEDNVMMNTVLYGPPGVGKTIIGTKLAKIWYSLGYLKTRRINTQNKNEFGSTIKDLFGSTGNETSSIDNSTMFAFMMMFIVILLILISLGWSFYVRFGGFGTFLAIGLIILIIVIFGVYISNSMNTTSEEPNFTVDTTSNSNFVQSFVSDIPSDDQIVKIAKRADLVGKFVGWTDKTTLELLHDSLGKVLFIDEAYDLVHDMHDSFGMEALNTINQFLSEHPNEIIIIFAGYKDLMEAGIFSVQPGLKRRCMWQFDCNGYTPDELFQIFKMQLNKKGWKISDEQEVLKLFRENKDSFPAYGGDCERLSFFSGLEHSRDYINNESKSQINVLTPDHVRRGLVKLKDNNIDSKPSDGNINPLAKMMNIFKNKDKLDNNISSDSIINAMLNASNQKAYH